jgi:hypothetical protein
MQEALRYSAATTLGAGAGRRQQSMPVPRIPFGI